MKTKSFLLATLSALLLVSLSGCTTVVEKPVPVPVVTTQQTTETTTVKRPSGVTETTTSRTNY